MFNVQYPIIKFLAAALAWGLTAAAQEEASPTFALGEVLVVGTEDAGGDGTAAQVTGAQADQRGRANVADAAALAPGVTLTRIGGRNAAAALVRGFDTRQVPLFIDGTARMTESAAICEYLAQQYAPTTLSVGPGEGDYADYLNYLHMSDTTLTFPQTLVLRYSRFEPPERLQPQVAEDYGKWFHARLRTLEAHVAGHEFLCAGRFTAADVAVGYALMLAELLGLDDRFTPAVAVYWQRLSGRAAYRRALAAQDSAAREQGVSPLPATA